MLWIVCNLELLVLQENPLTHLCTCTFWKPHISFVAKINCLNLILIAGLWPGITFYLNVKTVMLFLSSYYPFIVLKSCSKLMWCNESPLWGGYSKVYSKNNKYIKHKIISHSYLNRPSATSDSYIVFSAGLMRELITWSAPLLPSLLPRSMHAFSMHTA